MLAQLSLEFREGCRQPRRRRRGRGAASLGKATRDGDDSCCVVVEVARREEIAKLRVLGAQLFGEALRELLGFELGDPELGEVCLKHVVQSGDRSLARNKISPRVVGGRDDVVVVVARESVEQRLCPGDALGCSNAETAQARLDPYCGLSTWQKDIAYGGRQGVCRMARRRMT